MTLSQPKTDSEWTAKSQEVSLPTSVIESKSGLGGLDLGAIWDYRELLYILIWRDVKVRYKQTVIGAGWAIFQPVMTM